MHKMLSRRSLLSVAIVAALPLVAFAQDVTVTPPAGGGFVVNAAAGTPGLTVDTNGNLLLNSLTAAGAQTEATALCFNAASGQVGACSTLPVGPTGPTGPQGIQGVQGPTGPQGIQGAAGATGSAGAQGATGAQGPIGPTGPQGVQGSQGSTGAVGAQGPTGPQGIQGVTGATGSAGAQGATGAQGPVGPTGAQGTQGPTGATGAQGVAGSAGPTGVTGATGATGATGVTGAGFSNGTAAGQVYLTGATPFSPTSPQTVSGDVTISSAAVTSIANNATSGNHIVTALGSANTGTIPAARLGTNAGTAGKYLDGTGNFSAPASGNIVPLGGTLANGATIPTASTAVVYFVPEGATITLPPATTAGQTLLLISSTASTGTGFTAQAPAGSTITDSAFLAGGGSNLASVKYISIHLVSNGSNVWYTN